MNLECRAIRENLSRWCSSPEKLALAGQWKAIPGPLYIKEGLACQLAMPHASEHTKGVLPNSGNMMSRDEKMLIKSVFIYMVPDYNKKDIMSRYHTLLELTYLILRRPNISQCCSMPTFAVS